MRPEQISAAPIPMEISGESFLASPLSDRSLDYLTQWIRYQINKKAREESQFATSGEEQREIKEFAHEQSLKIRWYENTGLSILSSISGTIEVAYLLIRKEHPKFKKQWLLDKFGTEENHTEEQFANIAEVRRVFVEVTSLDEEDQNSKEETDPKKKSEKKNSTES